MVDWLQCLEWTGNEKDLPVGEKTLIPGYRAVNLVRFWEILDADSDEGYKVVKKAELRPGDIIIGAQINENSYQRVRKHYGPNFMLFKLTNWPEYLNREEAEIATRVDPDKPGMDVLELQALKEIRNMRGVFHIKG